jgi:hypothetical protein
MKLKALLTILIVITIISLLTTCKKYPENDLWFKSPESAFTYGNLRAFTVDGVDSMPMWNALYNTGPDYNGYYPPGQGGPLNATDIVLQVTGNKLGSQIGSGSWHFFSNKKYVYIFFEMEEKTNRFPPALPKYNLFYTRESNWKVLKLTKSGDLKIQRTYNNKVYEMEFD